MPGKVLLVDDDPGVLSALRRAFALDGYEVVVAPSGEEALEQFGRGPADLVVLDLMLPDINGFEVCEALRKVTSVPILMLTARDTVPDRVAGLDRGADDYLVKPFAVDELLARCRALLRRTGAATTQLTFEDVAVDTDGRQAFRGGRDLHLTPREYDLLAFFLRHPNQALSREQLCQQVWGFAHEGESNFVDAAVKDLRKKLEAGLEPRIIDTVRGHGYALRHVMDEV